MLWFVFPTKKLICIYTVYTLMPWVIYHWSNTLIINSAKWQNVL